MIAWENPDFDYRLGPAYPVPRAAETARLMSILVLYAHPVETSFNAGLHRMIVER